MVFMSNELPADAQDWDIFGENPVDDQERISLQNQSDEVDKMFYRISNNTYKYLYETYVETSIARPGDDLLQIGIRQGKSDLVRAMINAKERIKTQGE